MEDNLKDLASAKIDEVDMDGVAGGMGLGAEYWQEKYLEENKDDVNVPYVKWAGGDSCNQKMDDDLKNWGITNQK